MLVWLVASAHAQSTRFDGQLFRPSADAQNTTWVEDTHTAPDGYATGRVFLHSAVAPVRYQGTDGETDRLVSGQVGLDLAGAWYYKGLRMGASLPVYAWTGGDFAASEPGLGDLAVDLKGNLLDRDDNVVGLALLGRMMLPTASVEVPLGSTGIGWELTAVADRQWDDFTFAANLGTRGVPRTTFEDLVWNDSVFARLGVGYAVNADVGVSGELGMQTNWASGRNPAGTPVELLGGGWGRLNQELLVRGGLSMGLSRSPGAPLARLVAGMSYEPDMYPDHDVDGIVDRDDWCRDEPEDLDGFEDADGCLDRSVTVRLEALTADGSQVPAAVVLDGPEHVVVSADDPYVTLHPGTYTATVTANGVAPSAQELVVPLEPGAVLQLPVVALEGTLRVFAVDLAGNPVDARITLSGVALDADAGPVEVPIGEHALVVSARGYEAVALSVVVDHGSVREIPVVLRPAGPPPGTDERLGRR
jgi:hypothetical protein